MELVLRRIGGADEESKDLWSMHQWLNMLNRALTKTEEKRVPKLTTQFWINNVIILSKEFCTVWQFPVLHIC
jgi:hypothetical protein